VFCCVGNEETEEVPGLLIPIEIRVEYSNRVGSDRSTIVAFNNRLNSSPSRLYCAGTI
jgi:hypothetical protein